MNATPFDDRAVPLMSETNEDIKESLATADDPKEINSLSEADSENENKDGDASEVEDESEVEDDSESESEAEEEEEEDEEEEEEEEEEEDEEDDSTDYSFDNHEARDAMQLIHTRNYAAKGLAEHGPKDADFRGPLKALDKLPPEMKTMILIEIYLPGPRTIRVLYNSTSQVWTYRCKTPPNQIPFVIHGLKGLLQPSAACYFRKAPNMGADAYPFFNPKLDTLFLEYLPCGTSPEDSHNYITAMKKAARKLIHHFKTLDSTPIRRLEVTWCMNEDRLCQVLNLFRSIRTLERVTLTAHDHYSEAFEDRPNMDAYNGNRQYEDDPVAMMHMVKAGELQGSMVNVPGKGMKYRRYPFEVVLLDSNGTNMEEELAEHDL